MLNRTFIKFFDVIAFFRFLNPIIKVWFLRARYFLILNVGLSLLYWKVKFVTILSHLIALLVVILLRFFRLLLRLGVLSSHASRTEVKTFRCVFRCVILLSLNRLSLDGIVAIISQSIACFRCWNTLIHRSRDKELAVLRQLLRLSRSSLNLIEHVLVAV